MYNDIGKITTFDTHWNRESQQIIETVNPIFGQNRNNVVKYKRFSRDKTSNTKQSDISENSKNQITPQTTTCHQIKPLQDVDYEEEMAYNNNDTLFDDESFFHGEKNLNTLNGNEMNNNEESKSILIPYDNDNWNEKTNKVTSKYSIRSTSDALLNRWSPFLKSTKLRPLMLNSEYFERRDAYRAAIANPNYLNEETVSVCKKSAPADEFPYTQHPEWQFSWPSKPGGWRSKKRNKWKEIFKKTKPKTPLPDVNWKTFKWTTDANPSHIIEVTVTSTAETVETTTEDERVLETFTINTPLTEDIYDYDILTTHELLVGPVDVTEVSAKTEEDLSMQTEINYFNITLETDSDLDQTDEDIMDSVNKQIDTFNTSSSTTEENLKEKHKLFAVADFLLNDYNESLSNVSTTEMDVGPFPSKINDSTTIIVSTEISTTSVEDEDYKYETFSTPQSIYSKQATISENSTTQTTYSEQESTLTISKTTFIAQKSVSTENIYDTKLSTIENNFTSINPSSTKENVAQQFSTIEVEVANHTKTKTSLTSFVATENDSYTEYTEKENITSKNLPSTQETVSRESTTTEIRVSIQTQETIDSNSDFATNKFITSANSKYVSNSIHVISDIISSKQLETISKSESASEPSSTEQIVSVATELNLQTTSSINLQSFIENAFSTKQDTISSPSTYSISSKNSEDTISDISTNLNNISLTTIYSKKQEATDSYSMNLYKLTETKPTKQDSDKTTKSIGTSSTEETNYLPETITVANLENTTWISKTHKHKKKKVNKTLPTVTWKSFKWTEDTNLETVSAISATEEIKINNNNINATMIPNIDQNKFNTKKDTNDSFEKISNNTATLEGNISTEVSLEQTATIALKNISTSKNALNVDNEKINNKNTVTDEVRESSQLNISLSLSTLSLVPTTSEYIKLVNNQPTSNVTNMAETHSYLKTPLSLASTTVISNDIQLPDQSTSTDNIIGFNIVESTITGAEGTRKTASKISSLFTTFTSTITETKTEIPTTTEKQMEITDTVSKLGDISLTQNRGQSLVTYLTFNHTEETNNDTVEISNTSKKDDNSKITVIDKFLESSQLSSSSYLDESINASFSTVSLLPKTFVYSEDVKNESESNMAKTIPVIIGKTDQKTNGIKDSKLNTQTKGVTSLSVVIPTVISTTTIPTDQTASTEVGTGRNKIQSTISETEDTEKSISIFSSVSIHDMNSITKPEVTTENQNTTYLTSTLTPPTKLNLESGSFWKKFEWPTESMENAEQQELEEEEALDSTTKFTIFTMKTHSTNTIKPFLEIDETESSDEFTGLFIPEETTKATYISEYFVFSETIPVEDQFDNNLGSVATKSANIELDFHSAATILPKFNDTSENDKFKLHSVADYLLRDSMYSQKTIETDLDIGPQTLMGTIKNWRSLEYTNFNFLYTNLTTFNSKEILNATQEDIYPIANGPQLKIEDIPIPSIYQLNESDIENKLTERTVIPIEQEQTDSISSDEYISLVTKQDTLTEEPLPLESKSTKFKPTVVTITPLVGTKVVGKTFRRTNNRKLSSVTTVNIDENWENDFTSIKSKLILNNETPNISTSTNFKEIPSTTKKTNFKSNGLDFNEIIENIKTNKLTSTEKSKSTLIEDEDILEILTGHSSIIKETVDYNTSHKTLLSTKYKSNVETRTQTLTTNLKNKLVENTNNLESIKTFWSLSGTKEVSNLSEVLKNLEEFNASSNPFQMTSNLRLEELELNLYTTTMQTPDIVDFGISLEVPEDNDYILSDFIPFSTEQILQKSTEKKVAIGEIPEGHILQKITDQTTITSETLTEDEENALFSFGEKTSDDYKSCKIITTCTVESENTTVFNHPVENIEDNMFIPLIKTNSTVCQSCTDNTLSKISQSSVGTNKQLASTSTDIKPTEKLITRQGKTLVTAKKKPEITKDTMPTYFETKETGTIEKPAKTTNEITTSATEIVYASKTNEENVKSQPILEQESTLNIEMETKESTSKTDSEDDTEKKLRFDTTKKTIVTEPEEKTIEESLSTDLTTTIKVLKDTEASTETQTEKTSISIGSLQSQTEPTEEMKDQTPNFNANTTKYIEPYFHTGQTEEVITSVSSTNTLIAQETIETSSEILLESKITTNITQTLEASKAITEIQSENETTEDTTVNPLPVTFSKIEPQKKETQETMTSIEASTTKISKLPTKILLKGNKADEITTSKITISRDVKATEAFQETTLETEETTTNLNTDLEGSATISSKVQIDIKETRENEKSKDLTSTVATQSFKISETSTEMKSESESVEETMAIVVTVNESTNLDVTKTLLESESTEDTPANTTTGVYLETSIPTPKESEPTEETPTKITTGLYLETSVAKSKEELSPMNQTQESKISKNIKTTKSLPQTFTTIRISTLIESQTESERDSTKITEAISPQHIVAHAETSKALTEIQPEYETTEETAINPFPVTFPKTEPQKKETQETMTSMEPLTKILFKSEEITTSKITIGRDLKATQAFEETTLETDETTTNLKDSTKASSKVTQFLNISETSTEMKLESESVEETLTRVVTVRLSTNFNVTETLLESESTEETPANITTAVYRETIITTPKKSEPTEETLTNITTGLYLETSVATSKEEQSPMDQTQESKISKDIKTTKPFSQTLTSTRISTLIESQTESERDTTETSKALTEILPENETTEETTVNPLPVTFPKTEPQKKETQETMTTMRTMEPPTKILLKGDQSEEITTSKITIGPDLKATQAFEETTLETDETKKNLKDSTKESSKVQIEINPTRGNEKSKDLTFVTQFFNISETSTEMKLESELVEETLTSVVTVRLSANFDVTETLLESESTEETPANITTAVYRETIITIPKKSEPTEETSTNITTGLYLETSVATSKEEQSPMDQTQESKISKDINTTKPFPQTLTSTRISTLIESQTELERDTTETLKALTEILPENETTEETTINPLPVTFPKTEHQKKETQETMTTMEPSTKILLKGDQSEEITTSKITIGPDLKTTQAFEETTLETDETITNLKGSTKPSSKVQIEINPTRENEKSKDLTSTVATQFFKISETSTELKLESESVEETMTSVVTISLSTNLDATETLLESEPTEETLSNITTDLYLETNITASTEVQTEMNQTQESKISKGIKTTKPLSQTFTTTRIFTTTESQSESEKYTTKFEETITMQHIPETPLENQQTEKITTLIETTTINEEDTAKPIAQTLRIGEYSAEKKSEKELSKEITIATTVKTEELPNHTQTSSEIQITHEATTVHEPQEVSTKFIETQTSLTINQEITESSTKTLPEHKYTDQTQTDKKSTINNVIFETNSEYKEILSVTEEPESTQILTSVTSSSQDHIKHKTTLSRTESETVSKKTPQLSFKSIPSTFRTTEEGNEIEASFLSESKETETTELATKVSSVTLLSTNISIKPNGVDKGFYSEIASLSKSTQEIQKSTFLNKEPTEFKSTPKILSSPENIRICLNITLPHTNDVSITETNKKYSNNQSSLIERNLTLISEFAITTKQKVGTKNSIDVNKTLNIFNLSNLTTMTTILEESADLFHFFNKTGTTLCPSCLTRNEGSTKSTTEKLLTSNLIEESDNMLKIPSTSICDSICKNGNENRTDKNIEKYSQATLDQAYTNLLPQKAGAGLETKMMKKITTTEMLISTTRMDDEKNSDTTILENQTTLKNFVEPRHTTKFFPNQNNVDVASKNIKPTQLPNEIETTNVYSSKKSFQTDVEGKVLSDSTDAQTETTSKPSSFKTDIQSNLLLTTTAVTKAPTQTTEATAITEASTEETIINESPTETTDSLFKTGFQSNLLLTTIIAVTKAPTQTTEATAITEASTEATIINESPTKTNESLFKTGIGSNLLLTTITAVTKAPTQTTEATAITEASTEATIINESPTETNESLFKTDVDETTISKPSTIKTDVEETTIETILNLTSFQTNIEETTISNQNSFQANVEETITEFSTKRTIGTNNENNYLQSSTTIETKITSPYFSDLLLTLTEEPRTEVTSTTSEATYATSEESIPFIVTLSDNNKAAITAFEKDNETDATVKENMFTKLNSEATVTKTVVIILNNSGQKIEKLNTTFLQKLLHRKLPELNIEYVDIRNISVPLNKQLGSNVPDIFKNRAICKSNDFESNNECVCDVDSYLNDIKNNLDNTINIKNVHCKKLIDFPDGFVITNKTEPLKRKKRSLLYLKNLTKSSNFIENDNIEDVLDNDYEVQETDMDVLAYPGRKVRIFCINAADKLLDNENISYNWEFKKELHQTGEVLHFHENPLVIQNVEVKTTGNYTCTKIEKDNMEKHVHELELITFPIYKIVFGVYYLVNDSCSLSDGDILFAYLPKIMNPILCGSTEKLCTVDMERPQCFSKDENNFYNVTITATMTDIHKLYPEIDDFKCNINCKLKAYSHLVKLVHKNAQSVKKIPVISKLHSNLNFLSNVTMYNSEASKPPKIITTCREGFGIEKFKQRLCVLCPKQTYSEEDQVYCKVCPVGQYQPHSGSKACLPCNSPLDDSMCLRMLYSDTTVFKLYVGIAFGTMVLLIVALLMWTSNTSRNYNSRTKVKYVNNPVKYQRNLRRKSIVDNDSKNTELEPLLEINQDRRRLSPPEIPPPDF